MLYAYQPHSNQFLDFSFRVKARDILPLQKLATEVDSLLQNFVYFGWNVSIAAHNSVHILLIIAFIVHTLRIGHNDVVNPPSLVSALLKHAGQLGTMKE